MKSVLMISPYFVPRRRVGALRSFKFAIHLEQFGYKPIVLYIPDSSSRPTDLEAKLLQKIESIKLATPLDKTSTLPGKGNSKEKEKQTIADWVDRHTPVDTWLYLFRMKFSSILKKVKTINPDIIWATGDPWSSLWLGNRLADKLSKPLICDFRDPWTLSKISLRQRSRFSHFFDKRIEREIIQRANKLVFTSKSAEDSYSDFYRLVPSKTATIHNSFSLLLDSYESKEKAMQFDKKFLNLVFFGRFRRLSPAFPVVNVLKTVREKDPVLLNKIRVHSFGIPDQACSVLIKKLNLKSQFVFHQSVEPELKQSVFAGADYLLLSTHPDREQVIPAKLWDYLSSNKPIISISSNPEIGRILKNSSAGVHFYPDQTNEIADLFIQLDTCKLNGTVPDIFKDVMFKQNRQSYESLQTTHQLAQIFDKILTHG